MDQPHVLSLQPYFGGSHRAFSNGWQKFSNLRWTELTLPARHWKWRMRHSAWHFAEQVNQLFDQGERWDAFFCTDMLNVAEFKGLVRREISNMPLVVYFHENQFVYPYRYEDKRDLHFAITNFTTALAADAVWFNSHFNLDSMRGEIEKLCHTWPDYSPIPQLEQFSEKSKVIYQGIESPPETFSRDVDARELIEPHIVWAARWEHDKGPDQLLELLRLLRNEDFSFRLSVIGQSFRNVPKSINLIKDEFENELVHWGFQESRDDYWSALNSADIFLSTANHEFFGLAAAEAIAVGLYPILPNRLAYPELILTGREEKSLFTYANNENAIELLKSVPSNWQRFQSLRLAAQVKKQFAWESQAKKFDCEILELINTAKA